MIRHPPAAATVSQQDVDALAARHHALLGRIQGRRAEHAAEPRRGEPGSQRADEPSDGLGAERERRQRMSTRQRLGLEQ
ncbi:hypothetical protein H4R18_000200 [Coemansia javaensis]|uniref:Uncharacterized protein n=1 Tax=Coemansia javaensis TaxID=2761396 RepID=A0A9W8HPC7_9FUNG|nr:hypothetical protein H4R18_000200 [Coemansia javaensis]